MKYTPMQYRFAAGKQLANRRGIYGGYLNLRRRGSLKEIYEWLYYYEKQIAEGLFCPKRGAKIVAHLEKLLAKAEEANDV